MAEVIVHGELSEPFTLIKEKEFSSLRRKKVVYLRLPGSENHVGC